MAGDNQPRVAIRFRSSTSHASRRHRARSHALEDDSDSDRDEQPQGQYVSIDKYGLDGTSNDSKSSRKQEKNHSTPRERERPQNSASKSNTTWGREEREGDSKAGNAEDEKQSIKYGLTITKKQTNERSAVKREPRSEESFTREIKGEEGIQKTADEEALESLLDESQGIRKRKRNDPESDRDAEDIDYKSMPVDDFGASLLMKFGWNGQHRGKVPEVRRRHANLAGLGAKSQTEIQDLDVWDQKVQKDERRPRIADHRALEETKRRQLEDRHDSYKRERDRERGRDRARDRDRDRR